MMTRDAASRKLCERATEVTRLLKLAANEQRLQILCRLREGEASVGEMIDLCGLSQSSVSQHLAKLRESGLVRTRRQATTIYYSIADSDVDALMSFLCGRFGEAGAESE